MMQMKHNEKARNTLCLWPTMMHPSNEVDINGREPQRPLKKKKKKKGRQEWSNELSLWSLIDALCSSTTSV